jgi:hypothetical protein
MKALYPDSAPFHQHRQCAHPRHMTGRACAHTCRRRALTRLIAARSASSAPPTRPQDHSNTLCRVADRSATSPESFPRSPRIRRHAYPTVLLLPRRTTKKSRIATNAPPTATNSHYSWLILPSDAAVPTSHPHRPRVELGPNQRCIAIKDSLIDSQPPLHRHHSTPHRDRTLCEHATTER